MVFETGNGFSYLSFWYESGCASFYGILYCHPGLNKEKVTASDLKLAKKNRICICPKKGKSLKNPPGEEVCSEKTSYNKAQ